MNSQAKLMFAIEKAKNGHELTARELLLEIVAAEPNNKQAWLWLVGLLDDPADLILACENILRIDPADDRVRRHLTTLRNKQDTVRKEQSAVLEQSVDGSLKAGEMNVALVHLREWVALEPKSEKAWKLLAKSASKLEEQVDALEQLSKLDPENDEKRALFERWAYYLENPFELAAFYEERGMLDLALGVYKKTALTAKGRGTWDKLVREIERLEYLQREKIAHVSPFFTILRLTAGMPILFFFLLVLHTGYDFDYLSFSMGMGFFAVFAGSFLVALASVRSEHVLWRRFGNAAGRAGAPIRFAVSVVGFTIMILPFLLLSMDAIRRWREGMP